MPSDDAFRAMLAAQEQMLKSTREARDLLWNRLLEAEAHIKNCPTCAASYRTEQQKAQVDAVPE